MYNFIQKFYCLTNKDTIQIQYRKYGSEAKKRGFHEALGSDLPPFRAE